MKKICYLFILLSILFTSCESKYSRGENQNSLNLTIEEKIENLTNSKDNQVIVVSHRGDWRNAPENSLQAIKNCIKMGVDMVEIDIRETKDGHLVLMHDKTLNRTTNGKGKVKEWTLDSLRTLNLKDGLGVVTKHKIPTLKEALEVSKNKILVNLDKSYKIFDKCYQIILETGTENQVVIKGGKDYLTVKKEFGEYLDKVHFMPILGLPNNSAKRFVDDYMNSENKPIAFEFTVKSDTINFLKKFKNIRDNGASIWVNSLWPHHNANHDDEEAVNNIEIYDWFINNHIDIIQTDRPQLLLNYLRKKGLHK
ncbi:glycerophosphodiester phosphodiesterase family protein [Polaribacter septentrionalilitoris]|uniref:glycerophosphodiester phosphodiesterase family protein n=1 Tax=Polaribacter septentrionalilitoris TaxID=2494657 RepID=UPI00135CCBBD|nr:glycerophosphodiester phosphodiesterase family protein [Polaribacter septentrionalilitoris]